MKEEPHNHFGRFDRKPKAEQPSPQPNEREELVKELTLKPCPFCGKAPSSFGTDLDGHWVGCCSIDFGAFDTEEDAAKAWNTRADTEPEDSSAEAFNQSVPIVQAYLGLESENIALRAKLTEARRLVEDCVHNNGYADGRVAEMQTFLAKTKTETT